MSYLLFFVILGTNINMLGNTYIGQQCFSIAIECRVKLTVIGNNLL